MKHFASSILAFAVAASIITDARAITCYALSHDAVTNTDHLLTFDSATPGTLTDVTLTNLGNGYTMLGMAMRITTQTLNAANNGVGSLWGIGTNDGNFRLYVIDPLTGIVTQKGNPFGASEIDNTISHDAWGFAFNPGKDRFQLVGRNFNYSVDPNIEDVVRNPDVHTVGSINPTFSGASFTTSSYGVSSQFYIVNASENHNLCTSTNIANGGLISEAGAMDWGIGLTAIEPSGLAISQNLTFLAASDNNLYSVDRSTGIATLVGPLPVGAQIRSLVIKPLSFPPVLPVTVQISGKKRVTTTKASRVIKGTAACQAGIKLVQYKINKGQFRPASGATSWKFKARLKIGRNKIFVQATGGNDVLSNIAKVRVTRR